MGRNDNDLAMLRAAPQHQAIATGPPGRAATEMLNTRDVEFLDFVDEKTGQHSPETALIARSATVEREAAPSDTEEQSELFSRAMISRMSGGIAVLVVLIALVLVWPSGKAEEETPVWEESGEVALAGLPERAASEEVEALFQLRVQSTPEGARVFVDDEARGVTNASLELQKDTLPLVVRLEHDDFETETLVLRTVPEEGLVFTLRRSEVRTPEPAPAPSRVAKSKASEPKRRASSASASPPPPPPPPPPSAPKEKDRIDSVLDRYLPEL